MDKLDSSNDPSHQQMKPVCSQCFEDEDIAGFIAEFGGPHGCSFCGQKDAPTAPLEDVAGHIRACLGRFFGFAHNQLPYESKDGGYLGKHWDTYDLLDEVGLALPRDSLGALVSALAHDIGDEVWCEWDWLTLDYDEEMKDAWRKFCAVIQYERRFFLRSTREKRMSPMSPVSTRPQNFSPNWHGFLNHIDC